MTPGLQVHFNMTGMEVRSSSCYEQSVLVPPGLESDLGRTQLQIAEMLILTELRSFQKS